MSWDVVVIGGGPGGMMAAGRAAEQGAKVLLLEKNPGLGKKLLITGGGRSNVLNAEPDVRTLLGKYGKAEQFLFSPFAKFGMQESWDFFNGRGMETKVEGAKRAFPVSDSAASVLETLQRYMKEGKVSVRTGVAVTGLRAEGGRVVAVRTGGDEIEAKAFVLATGGTSRPETGSTGDGFAWLREIGHEVRESAAALVPVAIREEWVKRLQGVTLDEVRMSVSQGGERQFQARGRVLFTHFGISGPMVLNASRGIGELIGYGPVSVAFDLFPTTDHGALDERLQALFESAAKKTCRNALKDVVPSAMAAVLTELVGIGDEVTCNDVRKAQRASLVALMKEMPMTVEKLMGLDKAVIASGGVALEEVDFRTMASRKFPNLFIVGDLLDIDRPSGGYSLQLCWTTGYVAGSSAALVK